VKPNPHAFGVDDIAVHFFGVDEDSCSKPGSIQPSATGKLLVSPEVLEALRVLNFGNRGYRETYSLAERSTPEWNANYLDTVKLIEGWKEDEEQNPEDYSFMKCLVYDRFAELVPPGKARDNAMDSYLQYLEQQYHTLENRNLWFSEVQILMSTAHYSKDAQDKRWILEHMTRSSNPVISLYAKLETLL